MESATKVFGDSVMALVEAAINVNGKAPASSNEFDLLAFREAPPPTGHSGGAGVGDGKWKGGNGNIE